MARADGSKVCRERRRAPLRTPRRLMHFVKSHGLGNDYIVIDAAELPAPLTAGQIARICDRNQGVGSDGILLLVPAWGDGADFGVRILNPDGSEAEKSGNGLRILAKYLREHGRATADTFTIATKGGRVECRCDVDAGRVRVVTVEMGTCTFLAPDIPMNGPAREVVKVPLQVDSQALLVTAVSVGNPHCVIFTEHLDEALVRKLGPLVERHPAFPNRVNVQWARVASRSAVDILIWERGAGFTLASGSSSSAVACAAVKNGLCDHGLITVRMPGGTLHVEVRPDWSIRLQGPVAEVYAGALSRDFMDALYGADS
jgi:diaminopimelate epimerase